MGVIEIANKIDKNLLAVLVTAFSGFIAWLVKRTIEIPINNSRELFFKYFERRIELLGTLKVRLGIIALFPGNESVENKIKIRETLLSEGNAAYLDSHLLTDIISIVSSRETDEATIVRAISSVNNALASQIGKIEQSNIFFKKYSNETPVKRVLGYLTLALNYILTIIILLSVVFLLIMFLWSGDSTLQFWTIFISVLIIVGLNIWLES